MYDSVCGFVNRDRFNKTQAGPTIRPIGGLITINEYSPPETEVPYGNVELPDVPCATPLESSHDAEYKFFNSQVDTHVECPYCFKHVSAQSLDKAQWRLVH